MDELIALGLFEFSTRFGFGIALFFLHAKENTFIDLNSRSLDFLSAFFGGCFQLRPFQGNVFDLSMIFFSLLLQICFALIEFLVALFECNFIRDELFFDLLETLSFLFRLSLGQSNGIVDISRSLFQFRDLLGEYSFSLFKLSPLKEEEGWKEK